MLGLAPALAALALAAGARADEPEQWRLELVEYASPRREDLHFFRLLNEISAVLLAGGVWYTLDVELNRLDFTYRLDLPSLRDKYLLGEGFRFDDNAHWLNSPGHPLVGGAAFFLARKNGFDPLAALFATSVQALSWEVIVEYREVVSLNDMIFTPASGFVIGEAAFATASYLINTRRPVGLAVDGAMGVLDRFHAFLEGGRDHRHERAHMLGFEPAMPGVVEAYGGALGFFHEGRAGAAVQLGLSSRLWRIPRLFSPARVRVLFTDTVRSELRADLSLAAHGPRDLNLDAAVTIAGVAWQDIARDDEGRAVGGTLLLSLGGDFSHEEHLGFVHDRLTRAGLVAGSLEGYGTLFGAEARVRIDVSPDFATVIPRSLAAEPRLLEGVRTTSVLEKEGYYYAFGASGGARSSLAFGPLELEGSVRVRGYRSIDVLDRRLEEVRDVLHGNATRVETAFGAGVEVPGLPLTLRARVLRRWQRDFLAHLEGEGAVELAALTAHVPL